MELHFKHNKNKMTEQTHLRTKNLNTSQLVLEFIRIIIVQKKVCIKTLLKRLPNILHIEIYLIDSIVTLILSTNEVLGNSRMNFFNNTLDARGLEELFFQLCCCVSFWFWQEIGFGFTYLRA